MSKRYLRIFYKKWVVLILGAFALFGCSRSGATANTAEVPTSIPLTPTASVPTIQITVAPENALPTFTTTAAAPTRDNAIYPAPVEVTQTVGGSTSTPTLSGGENSTANPYPILETPIPKPAGLSSTSAYPPPVQAIPTANNTISVPSATPGDINPATPTPQGSAVGSAIPALTPQATIVKTQFAATDPTTVNLKAGRPQLIVFYAEWCMLCKSIAPVVLSLESQYQDRMNFIYLDVDDRGTNSIQKSFNYTLIARPRVFLIDGTGVILRDWMGYVPLDQLQEAIGSIIPASP